MKNSVSNEDTYTSANDNLSLAYRDYSSFVWRTVVRISAVKQLLSHASHEKVIFTWASERIFHPPCSCTYFKASALSSPTPGSALLLTLQPQERGSAAEEKVNSRQMIFAQQARRLLESVSFG